MLVQVLGDAPWEALQPTLVKLLDETEQNKQRAAAELLAGVLGGMSSESTFFSALMSIRGS